MPKSPAPLDRAPFHIDWTVSAPRTRFRALTSGSWRKGFRLEEAYWSLLEIASAKSGLKLGEYVRRLVENAGSENATAKLRLHLTELMNSEIAALGGTDLPGQIAGLLRASPVPCFAIDRSKRLVGFNPEFEQHVSRQVARLSAQARQSDRSIMSGVRLTLEQSVERIIELHARESGPPLECGYLISTPAYRHAGRVRTALLRSAGTEIVVAFVLS